MAARGSRSPATYNGRVEPGPRRFYWNHDNRMWALREANWKLVITGSDATELFDLASDPVREDEPRRSLSRSRAGIASAIERRVRKRRRSRARRCRSIGGFRPRRQDARGPPSANGDDSQGQRGHCTWCSPEGPATVPRCRLRWRLPTTVHRPFAWLTGM